MSPLVITVILVFAAGVVGFFFGCLFARWLNSPDEVVADTQMSLQPDLAPIPATPTASDPSTSVMTFKSAAKEPAATPPTPAVAAATPAEKAAKPAPASRPPPAAVPAPPPAAAPAPDHQPPAAGATPSTAAGSANPAATPLRGPLAVARATPKDDKKAKPRTRRKTAAKSAPKKPATATAKKTPVTMAGETQAKKPRFMPKPRKSGADDLKRIKGVGPALEKTLNGLGVFHYNQVSKWTPENVMWVDDHLKFKGRIARDNWIDQAAKLDAGETTEFAARVDKGTVASSKGKPRAR